VAILLLWLGGGKGDNAGVMRRVGGVFVALGIIGLAVTGAGVDIGTFIASLFATSGWSPVRIPTAAESYRVDAVWLGPPKATFPWRARYVAWGVGIVVFLLVLAVERRLGIGFGFFSTAWAVVITVALTRLICSRISHERPLSAVMTMWLRELTAPREKTSA